MEEIIFWMEDAADSGVKKIADKVAGDVELVTDRRPRVLYGTAHHRKNLRMWQNGQRL